MLSQNVVINPPDFIKLLRAFERENVKSLSEGERQGEVKGKAIYCLKDPNLPLQLLTSRPPHPCIRLSLSTLILKNDNNINNNYYYWYYCYYYYF